MSNCLSGGKGRFMPRSSTTTVSPTVTTKLPLPGFSGLTDTLAFCPTALTILLARDLKAPQDLQASIKTSLSCPPPMASSSWFFLAAAFLVSLGSSTTGSSSSSLSFVFFFFKSCSLVVAPLGFGFGLGAFATLDVFVATFFFFLVSSVSTSTSCVSLCFLADERVERVEGAMVWWGSDTKNCQKMRELMPWIHFLTSEKKKDPTVNKKRR